jgi:hypothetical protein
MEESSRKVVTRAPGRTVRILNLQGVLPKPVEAESRLEADLVRQVALNQLTKVIIGQPYRIPVSPEGYTPDYLVTTADEARIVIEVKLARKVAKYATLFDDAAKYLRDRKHEFFVATEKTIRRDRLHERALLILRYAKATYSERELQRALEAAEFYKKGLALGTLIAKTKLRRELIFHLIGRRKLTTGPRLSLDYSALVFATSVPEMSNEDFLGRWLGVAPWGKDIRDRQAA